MDSEYDQKFEEMKKYIPFLESMIKRLESTSPASSNPRQAQLDKIRSLRDLLLNKKKRMKMENLLKCEQVLINLYAKVEQRDTLSVPKKAPDPNFSIDPPTPQEKSDLEAVRIKLKTVAKRQEEVQETLPEILRGNEVEEIHTAGSKEPALFQRRPNKSSLSPTHRSPTKTKEEKVSPQSSASKRNYTRVLVSPDATARRWSISETAEDKPLFSRRSPRRSPRRFSPSYHKKERKKSFKESTTRKSKDLNITLNVPEDSLSTLNTKDIFTRIINCKDGDVDIDTLRVLRKQILTELKKTGARDDISDLILKSYNKKKVKPTRKEEVEEGELSDSESEVIENVYGNLSGNLILKDPSDSKSSMDKEKARKIQICLVINSDKDNSDPNTSINTELPKPPDILELEMYDKESKAVNKTVSNKDENQQEVIKVDDDGDIKLKIKTKEDKIETNKKDVINIQDSPVEDEKLLTPNESVKYTANFYKPLTDSTDSVKENKPEENQKITVIPIQNQNKTDVTTDNKTKISVVEVSVSSQDMCNIEAALEKMEKPVEIPLLNEPTIPKTSSNSTLSEIDILQALKNEILSETITIPGAEASTPALHQPKIIKVASAREILPKKRISIENYKQKIESSIRLYFDDSDSKDDLIKKPSLKLTEKECERFNIPKISFDDESSDADDGGEIQANDVYSDIAPKSPDCDESSNIESAAPVIIPADPVKKGVVNHKTDVDMRTLPILSPINNKPPTLISNFSGISSNEKDVDNTKSDTKTDQGKSQNRSALLDPRVRRDISSSQSPSPHTVNPDRTPRPVLPNLSPITNLVLTPNARSYEMTPNHQSFDIDQPTNKHVYVPSFTLDSRDREISVAKDSREKIDALGERKSRFDDIGDASWSSSDVSRYSDTYTSEKFNKGQRNDRYNLDNRDSFSHKRLECPRTPGPSFGRSDVPNTSTQTFNRLEKPMTPLHPFGRADCPTTPSHHFGRSECPPTPSHSFGRSECPPTPSPSFGRSERPSTPNHSFGSHSFNLIECPLTASQPFSECPQTPTPLYGRNECPPTPNHTFARSDSNQNHSMGLSERPQTPNHHFGRSDTSTNIFGRSDFNAPKYTKDPRLNRKTEYESHSQFEERDRVYYKDRGYYRGSSYKSLKSINPSETYQSHDREHGRNNRYRYYAPEKTGYNLNKDQPRREQSVGGSREYENDRLFSRERGQFNSDNRGYEDVSLRRGNQRERSVGRNAYSENKREKNIGHTRSESSFTRSSSRAPSVGRNSIESENNTLSVKSSAGRKFTIDTSVNATFQKFLESGKGLQVFEYNFDARRQRAASVGRSLIRESSCGRVLSDGSKRNTENQNKEVFRRASSVGRDLANHAAEKRSFQEIKADFKTYKLPVKELSKFDTAKIRNIDTKSKNAMENIARSRKDYDKHKEEKFGFRQAYYSRLNYRDPRTRKDDKLRKLYCDDHRGWKKGIVYSNDNIVKGAILTSGYGVKNYKIPKIKRVIEEEKVAEPSKIDQVVNKKDEDRRKIIEKRKDEEDISLNVKTNEKSKDKNKVTTKQIIKDVPEEKINENSSNKNKESPKRRIKEIIKESDNNSGSETDNSSKIERRSTRLSRKMKALKTTTDAVTKTRKYKKSIISDSDSDTDMSIKEKIPNVDENVTGITTTIPIPQLASPGQNKKIESPQPNAVDMNTSFGLELEMFSENIVSDPVLDNINALIADLDNDLDASKNESSNNFTKEITLENMMQNITCPQDSSTHSKELLNSVDSKIHEISLSSVKNEGNEVTGDVGPVNTEISQELQNTKESSADKSDSLHNFDKLLDSEKAASLQNNKAELNKYETLNSDNSSLNKPTNEDIVSTTETEKDTIPLVEDNSKIDEQSLDSCSTPDSTINTDAVLEKSKTTEGIADSTNEEVHNETNVTSTDSVKPKPSSSRTETASTLELGNLLTILQDKSKIKELLSMLGDQSGDNDKIKKKLEKLSEIVSDDEEEKADQEDSKSEMAVLTNDKNLDSDQKLDEKITNETESQLNKKDETESQLIKKDEPESQLNINDEAESQLNKYDEAESQLNKYDEAESQLNKKDEAESQLNKKVEAETLMNKKDEPESQLNKKDEAESQLNKKDEAESQLNKKDEAESKLNKKDEETESNTNEDRENDDEQDKEESVEDSVGEDSVEIDETVQQVTKPKYKKKMPGKKSKFSKKGKGRYAKKVTSIAEKRVTRATAAVETKKPKKPPRELQQLHDDIKEMFIRDDILSATGIRMCRLAKMVDEKTATKDDAVLPEVEPVVVIEKFKNSVDKSRDPNIPEKVRKKPGPKPKPKTSTGSPETEKPKYKPGPKSRTKNKKELDHYAFEIESVGDTNIEKASDDDSDITSDSEVCSLASSKSFGSSEILADIKKKNKRKRRGGWQDGVIKPKHKKKKLETKLETTLEPLESNLPTEKQIAMPDMNCFTDRNYCFSKNELFYSCRLCVYSGIDIVHHYKNEHPHDARQIPLSRMSAAVAKEAIEQCKEMNFRVVSKIPSDKYVCIFCFQEFGHNNSVLETFFWHVVSMHTGEYKHSCSECSDENRCPRLSLDIPPPPKDTKGQLIGYICKKCNFTQISLENLKTHVIDRHNDEQTAVYTINLSAMTKDALKEFLRRRDVPESPVLYSSSSPREITTRKSVETSVAETSAPVCGSVPPQRKPAKRMSALAGIQSKITFEADDNVVELSDLTREKHDDPKIKIERHESEHMDSMPEEHRPDITSIIERPAEVTDHQPIQPTPQDDQRSSPTSGLEDLPSQPSNDIVDYPHFKINITESGAKEYICCINGKDNHFKTTLLISMKKHVQLKHSENWDGYCFICKVIVTPQGAHKFKDCFQHYLDKHMDNFPILQKEVLPDSLPAEVPDKQITRIESPAPSKPYINVRPIYELISNSEDSNSKEAPNFPIIQSVVSLGAVESPRHNPTYPTVRQERQPTEVSFKYEEVQAKVMSNKHRVVLETMMARDKLVKVYKCAGRFCSFTSDSAEDALLHASTHERIGGVDALNCSYCDFDAMGNAIDLVMHVFKAHGHCQYSCGQCFYRAAASQSVGAHATRVHGVAKSGVIVLRTTTVPTNAAVEGPMLTREEAVPYYICTHQESGGVLCKFRTYTPDKYCEHLQQRHSAATCHPCYFCRKDIPSTAELVQHMKSHGLKLYQCTWCIFGAANESELLAHVSTAHPTKQPQAYLRIITNKEGSNELRVLPLAFLNKMKVPTEDVTPSTTKENPVREAERSIDLEKLIGLTMMMEPQVGSIEPTPVNTEPQEDITEPIERPVAPIVTVDTAAPVPDGPAPELVRRLLSPVSTAVASITAEPENQQPVTLPAASISADPPLNVTQAPVIKSEASETSTMPPSEVVVLDSDEEEAKQSVIDLSDEDISTTSKKDYTNKKVPTDILSTCPKCRQRYKSINGLKKHLHYCYPNKEEASRCAHCPYLASNRDNIMQHYMDDHCDRNIYQCGICRINLMSVSVVKKHIKYVHKIREYKVQSTVENGITCYCVNAAKKKEVPKRKLSVTETLTKRRFLPQEINLLPINPILEHLVYCEICEFSTKVRLNMVRHLQLHAEQQPVPQTAPVNPVPHLESNEKHFDKMVNLASSSIVNRAHEKRGGQEHNTDKVAFVAVHMPPELAARYPKQISARQRNTCGAIGCTYTSVDEPMLKRHWEALHSGPTSFNFRCVHCPNTQITDTSKPITGARVVAHLKMHDDTLYACSKCNFYHFKREVLEKHLTDTHPNGQLMIVRENASAAAVTAAIAATSAAVAAAPTMDLKPWQCGFCKFKSMLRPEVADHCFKIHQSKMQFRCGYCPYRASALENVHNHLTHSHANDPVDVIYYYYREGSLPDEPDGTPRWMKQRQKMGSNMPEVKTEEQDTSDPTPVATPPPVNIDLKLVKKEVDEGVIEGGDSIEDLCKRFGDFCEPNGIRFKCPLCNVITEDTREAMQSHLYEELQYRKWGCGLCNYKAFHKEGLTEHMSMEHFRQYDHIELPIDSNKEKWVAAQLDHQAAIINKYKLNMAQHKSKLNERRLPEPRVPTPKAASPRVASPPPSEIVHYTMADVQEAFGGFGAPVRGMYCCPMCKSLLKDEASMADHMEMEINKIRWGCSSCSSKHQTYHEAQFHCKDHSVPSRPKEMIRDATMRAAWINDIIAAQKKVLQNLPAPMVFEPATSDESVPEVDNSLLVVRYEERVPTPDQLNVRRKRPAPESDDERLVIDEAAPKRAMHRSCSLCSYKCKHYNSWKEHVLKHYNLKPFGCCYCDFSCSYRNGIITHAEKAHPYEPLLLKMTPIPPAKPYIVSPKKRPSADDDVSKLICLFCEKSLPESEVDTHHHDNVRLDFARKGDVVVKCCICLALRLDVNSIQEHHNQAHPHVQLNYALFKLHHDHRETHYCGYCDDVGFKFVRDLRTHHNAAHPLLPFKATSVPFACTDSNEAHKKKELFPPPPVKRCARKSTTKLPGRNSVAKKSTTKLPYSLNTSGDGYSYYKTRPLPLEEYANVTTLMYFCNRMMPFTLKKLSEIINIEPKVVVKDIRAGNSSDMTSSN